jgi:hypothetical protein
MRGDGARRRRTDEEPGVGRLLLERCDGDELAGDVQQRWPLAHHAIGEVGTAMLGVPDVARVRRQPAVAVIGSQL